MNNKGYTLVELIMSVVIVTAVVAVGSGILYFGYLVIKALQKYVGA